MIQYFKALAGDTAILDGEWPFASVINVITCINVY